LVLLVGAAVGNGIYNQVSEEVGPPRDEATQSNPENRSDSHHHNASPTQHQDSAHHHHHHPETDKKNTGRTGYEDRYLNEYSSNSSPEWIDGDNFTIDQSVDIYEVTQYPDTQPTEEHLDAAWELYNSSYEAAKEEELFDLKKSRENGYKMYDFIHHVNKEYYLNGEDLNPHKPESLVYYRNFTKSNPSLNDTILAGYMYLTSDLKSRGEQVAGPLTVWHFRPLNEQRCFASTLNEGFEFDGIECAEGAFKARRTPEMIHVWFVKAPEGPFSTNMGSFEYAEEVYERWNESDGMPEKMSEEEFKSYVMESYNNYFK
jgi:hypothetical protein